MAVVDLLFPVLCAVVPSLVVVVELTSVCVNDGLMYPVIKKEATTIKINFRSLFDIDVIRAYHNPFCDSIPK